MTLGGFSNSSGVLPSVGSAQVPPKQVGISLAQPCFFDAEKMDMCRRDDWPPSWKHGWEIMGHGVQVELASEFNKDVGSSFSPPMKSTEG